MRVWILRLRVRWHVHSRHLLPPVKPSHVLQLAYRELGEINVTRNGSMDPQLS